MSVPRWSKKGRAGLKKAWARREKHRGREMVRLGTSEGGKGIKAEHPGGEKAPAQAVARAQPMVQPGGGQRRQRARGSDRSIRCRGWAGPSARQRTGGIGQKCTLVGASPSVPNGRRGRTPTTSGPSFEGLEIRSESKRRTGPPLRNRSKTVTRPGPSNFCHANSLRRDDVQQPFLSIFGG